MTAVNDPARPDVLTHAPAARATAAWSRMRAWKPLPHMLLAVAFTTVWTLLSILSQLHSADVTYDNAIFTQAVKGWATHLQPISTIKGPDFNLLGDHWSPILAVLAPLWWIWPSTLIVVTAQAVLFGWSVGIVSSTGARVLGRARGIGIGVAYGLSFGLQQGLDAGFHEYAFAVPILAVVGRQLLLARPARAFWWALPLLLVKEDMGPIVAIVGLLIAWRWRRWTLAGLLVVAGVCGTLLEVLVLIPHFNPAHQYDYAAHHLLPQQPWWRIALSTLWPFEKWQAAGWTFGITGFACLRSRIVLLAVPILAWRFAATGSVYWDIGWHYSETLMPIVFLAAVDGIDRMTYSKRIWQRWYRRQVIAGMVFAAIALTASLPLGIASLFEPTTWQADQHAQALAAADAFIPAGVEVSADTAQLSALVAKDQVAWAGRGDNQVRDWVAPDYITTDKAWWDVGDVVQWAEQQYPGLTYRIVWQQDGVTVLQRQH